MSVHSLLACRVLHEKTTVNLIGDSLWIISHFSDAHLNIFSFFSTVGSLTVLCPGEDCFWLCPCASCIWTADRGD